VTLRFLGVDAKTAFRGGVLRGVETGREEEGDLLGDLGDLDVVGVVL
jgi:hypothetical protein